MVSPRREGVSAQLSLGLETVRMEVPAAAPSPREGMPHRRKFIPVTDNRIVLTHMLRHACGFKLANDGVDTRALQHFLGHRNIMHTVRYTELRSDRFAGFWKD